MSERSTPDPKQTASAAPGSSSSAGNEEQPIPTSAPVSTPNSASTPTSTPISASTSNPDPASGSASTPVLVSPAATPTPAAGPAANPASVSAGHSVEIEIVHHRALFELLRDPRSLWRLLLTMFLLLVILFLGLSVVVFSIKKLYPYNAIETNIYGATTFEGENKDVTYWLFNTAELWANSGIEVRRGDVLTIRTSGAWHTAVHHLVSSAEKNTMLADSWVSSDGEDHDRGDERWGYRAQFRLSESNPDGVLLMEIIPQDSAKTTTALSLEGRSKPFMEYVSNNASRHLSRYVIAKERVNLLVKNDGLLHFAVNDIVLTRDVIRRMYRDFVDQLNMNDSLDDSLARELRQWVDSWGDTVTAPPRLKGKKIPAFAALKKANRPYLYGRNADSVRYQQPVRPGDAGAEAVFGPDCCLNNELIYYYNQSFVDAWYVDNVGSFLIVVERKRSSKGSEQ